MKIRITVMEADKCREIRSIARYKNEVVDDGIVFLPLDIFGKAHEVMMTDQGWFKTADDWNIPPYFVSYVSMREDKEL